MGQEITLRVIVQAPPPGVLYGVQKGQGKTYETMWPVVSNGGDVVFDIPMPLKTLDHAKPPVFVGPFVYRGAVHRSICLDIGTMAGQKDSCWTRRAGIPLPEASWDPIDEALKRGGMLVARIAGTSPKGGPTCATQHPIGGWQLP